MPLVEIQAIVDARRQSSAELVASVARAMRVLRPGDCVEALATDPASIGEIAAWCRRTGHVLVDRSGDGATYSFVIARP